MLRFPQKNNIKFPISYFIVKDKSMEPAFCEGDRVLTYNFGKVMVGSVVVFKFGEIKLIKRVRESLRSNSRQVKSDYIIVVSDNKKLAKKEFRVEKKDIIGRVVLRYRNPLG